MRTFTNLRSPDAGATGGGGTETAAAAGAATAGAGSSTGAGTGTGTGAAAADAAPKPFYDGLYGSDGKINKTSFDRLPDHLKAHKDLFSKYETVDAMLNGFANAHGMAVRKAMAPLAPDSPPEVVAERKAHLDLINNVPKDPKGYGIARPDDLPAEYWNDAAAAKFAELCVKHSTSPAAAKDFLALQIESTKGELEKGRLAETEFFSGQDRAFGDAIKKDGGDPDKALDLAKRGATTLGINPEGPIFKNAEVKLACLRAARLVAEDKLVSGDATGGGGMTEIDQARDIMRNPANPLHKAWATSEHPDNQKAKDRVNELYRIDGERKRKRGEAA